MYLHMLTPKSMPNFFTASSLSLTLSRVSRMSWGTYVLQKPVMRLKPPYVMMGMMPACSQV